MRNLLLSLLLLFAVNAYSQSYSYHFNGKLDEQQQQQLLTRIDELHFFTDVKLRYKADVEKGELLFTVPPKAKPSEEEQPYSILTIKALLIDMGLAPDTFTERTH